MREILPQTVLSLSDVRCSSEERGEESRRVIERSATKTLVRGGKSGWSTQSTQDALSALSVLSSTDCL